MRYCSDDDSALARRSLRSSSRAAVSARAASSASEVLLSGESFRWTEARADTGVPVLTERFLATPPAPGLVVEGDGRWALLAGGVPGVVFESTDETLPTPVAGGFFAATVDMLAVLHDAHYRRDDMMVLLGSCYISDG